MEENYWARQQRRAGQGFIRFADRDENYWTRGRHAATAVRPPAGLRSRSRRTMQHRSR